MCERESNEEERKEMRKRGMERSERGEMGEKLKGKRERDEEERWGK